MSDGTAQPVAVLFLFVPMHVDDYTQGLMSRCSTSSWQKISENRLRYLPFWGDPYTHGLCAVVFMVGAF